MLKQLLLSLRGHVLMKREQLSMNSCFANVPLKVCVEALNSSEHHQPSVVVMSCHCALSVAVLAFAGRWCLGAADVGDFAPCVRVFYKSWPPKGLAGTPICQRYHNQYRFATLYSRPRRAPWFSAYLYSAPTGKRPHSTWKFEPQVRIFKYRNMYLNKIS